MATKKRLKFSIITPSFNQGRFIEDTIQSVKSQNYDSFEHIIMDGGSTDETLDILKKYSHLRWTSKPDNGQTDAANEGIRMSTGDIIGWVNSDDVYFSDVFSKIESVFKNNPQVSAIYGDYYWIDGDGKYIKKVRELPFSAKRLLFSNCIAHPTAFLKRSAFDAVGFYREDFEYSMDYEFWLRFHKKCRILHIPLFIAKVRFHPVSKSCISKQKHRDYNKLIIQIHDDLFTNLRESKLRWYAGKIYYRLLKELRELYNNPVYFVKKIFFNIIGFLSVGRIEVDYRYKMYF